MGCLCGKPSLPDQESESPKERNGTRTAIRRSSISAKVETTDTIYVAGDKDKDRSKVRSKQNGTTSSAAKPEEAGERRRDRSSGHAEPHPRANRASKNLEGEQVAAGWPAWLSAVAGEAIKGWIPRHAASFEKIDKIGQGTYSNVYKARDLETGKIVALKKVRFDNLEPESVRFMAREIQVLRRLDHPNVVKLEGLVTSRMSCSLYLVFEYMEHDLAGLAACPGIMFTEAQVKCYLQQLLQGLDHCHRHGVLHRDIKGSNLLLDNGGMLKIADFGLATFFNPDHKQPLTSRVVTLWYRPPELLLGATEYGVAVDLWSTGCILAELLAGKPIMPGRTEVEQLHKIFKLCGSPSEDYWRKSKLPHATIFKPQQPYKRCIRDTFKEFPSSSLALLDTLLAIEPADRGSAAEALKSDFFTTKPLPCDPSSLPQYPPSKEFDAKLRDDEARRQRAAGGRAREASKRPGMRERTSRAVGAPDANAELAISLQKRRLNPHASVKSKSEKFAPVHEDATVSFSMHPQPRQPYMQAKGAAPVPASRSHAGPFISSRSGPQAPPNMVATSWSKKQKEEDLQSGPPHTSRPTKSVPVMDVTQGSYPQQAVVSSSISSGVPSRNGAGGTYYRERTGGRARDAAAVPHDGELTRRSGQHERTKHGPSSRREPTYAQDHASSITMDLPYKRDLSTVDSRQRDGMSQVKVPSKGNQSQKERMYHSGPLLLHPGYSGPGAVDYEEFLEDHEQQIQHAARRARENVKGLPSSTLGPADTKQNEHKSRSSGRKVDKSEIVEAGNGLIYNSSGK